MKNIQKYIILSMLLIACGCSNVVKSKQESNEHKLKYPIVDTGVSTYYSNETVIHAPKQGTPFFGQDASYQTNQSSYSDNGNNTVTDNVTGLMWQQRMDEKMTYQEAFAYAKASRLAGYDDWRVPTIKELYSLIQFTGNVKGQKVGDSLFIDTTYFDQPLGDTSIKEREIDAQTWSATKYVGKTMELDDTIFGVNFIDGRIKGYPQYKHADHSENKMYVRLVRGNEEYGINQFIDNKDGTITDVATGLMWQQEDSKIGMDWESALNYAEELTLAGYDDWHLPNAKELHSIVDYTRSPQTTNSAAIDPIFSISSIHDPNGNKNYPYFWTGTTHLDGVNPYSSAVYIAFGEAQGEMNKKLMDVHGAGAQRSDPKSTAGENFPQFRGPQGDVVYVNNYVRAVRYVDIE